MGAWAREFREILTSPAGIVLFALVLVALFAKDFLRRKVESFWPNFLGTVLIGVVWLWYILDLAWIEAVVVVVVLLGLLSEFKGRQERSKNSAAWDEHGRGW